MHATTALEVQRAPGSARVVAEAVLWQCGFRERERAITVSVAAMPNWPDYDLSNHGTCIDDDCCQSQGLESSRHQSIDA